MARSWSDCSREDPWLNGGDGAVVARPPAVPARTLTGRSSRGQNRTMPDRVTLDVIDRPAGGVVATLRRLKGVRTSRRDGLRALLGLGTAHFVPRVRPAPTLHRIALLSAWAGDVPVGDWMRTLGELCARAPANPGTSRPRSRAPRSRFR